MSAQTSFSGARPDMFGWSNAYLPIVFAYNGYNQANYILSEIHKPRRLFPRAVIIAVVSVSITYILVNISYRGLSKMVVVSKDEQMSGTKVALMFLMKFMPEARARHLYGAITSISSLGNIIVMTFTAARVKQEIAKEGILPFAKFFGETYFEDDAVPVGALMLHWTCSILLILVTWPMKPSGAYKILVNVTSYTLDAFFSTFLSVGMLYLRFKDHHWRDISETNHLISVLSAVIGVISNGYVLLASWFPPTQASPAAIKGLVLRYYPWFLAPTVSWTILALSVGYWLVFRFVVPQIGYRRGCELVVERYPHFVTRFGYTVQAFERIERSWVHRGGSAPEENELSNLPLNHT
ncbi:hypothetical protein GP486_003981 [Trichoglossum hirsutum]|uniref:Uncharacterized protein n=1 Tax=Trichoglossum hirsutum TaxID=265104 RepID=A0A9P8LBW9_9PEZI|nr:hypothetical protein GP486_003981 [Trichoglossum hirsutum]